MKQSPRDKPANGGGAHHTPEHPPAKVGGGSAAANVLVAVLGVIAIAVPVLGYLGHLAVVGERFGGAAATLLWVGWGLVAALVVGVIVVMFRRSSR